MCSNFSAFCAVYFFWGLSIGNNVIYKIHINEIYRDENRIKYCTVNTLTYTITLLLGLVISGILSQITGHTQSIQNQKFFQDVFVINLFSIHILYLG